MKKKNICFAVNTFEQAMTVIKEAKKNNINPIFFIKNYILKSFGIEWVEAFQIFLNKSYPKNSFEIYVDANYNFGLAIELIDLKTHYIKLKSNQIILKKINQIAKKNKVLLNPSFRIVDLCNIKNISRKIYSISIRGN